MTVEELREEAKKLGYTIQKSQTGMWSCWMGRECMLERGRKACLRYEYDHTTFNGKGKTYCKRRSE